MRRFLAFLWNEVDQKTAAIVHRLAHQSFGRDTSEFRTFEFPGLLVIARNDPSSSFGSYSLLNRQGVVLGQLFKNAEEAIGSENQPYISEIDSNKIIGTCGKSLVQDYWGAYIAFLADKDKGKHVLRDPTGAIQCNYITTSSFTLFFSHVSDVTQIMPDRLTINWQHIASYLRFSRFVSATTGFNEITQLQAGECCTFRNSRITTSFYWKPENICRESAVESADDAVNILRTSITTSIHQWARRYKKILLELSGGFDSSMVLACLYSAKPKPDVTCLNMYTEVPEGDERFFARKAAARAGAELIETVFHSRGKTLKQMLTSDESISPTMEILQSQSGERREEIANRSEIQAIFSGRGGDQLLQRRRGIFITTEYIHRHGFGKDLPRIIMDTARLTHSSVWPIVSAAIKYRLFKASTNPFASVQPPSFLADESDHLSITHSLTHPWICDVHDIPESKVQQIFDLIDTQNYFNTERCTYADFVPVLISQPIMECILRIPSYLLTVGGRERGLARRAFSTLIPSEIIHRKAKGLTINFFQDLLRDNQAFIRDFLLDGLLIRNHLLNRPALEAALTEEQLVRGKEIIALLSLIKAENWLRIASAHLSGSADSTINDTTSFFA